MEKNPFKWPIAIIGAILVWCTDLFFNIPAYLLWPTSNFSALTNWHSDLGRTIPHTIRGNNSALGAQFYNTGQVFEGVAIILFAGGLYVFYMQDKLKNILVIIGQFFGFLAGIGLIMNGIYSEDFGQPHSDWSNVIFISIIVAELLINVVLLFNPKFKRPIAYFGFITCAVTIVLLFIEIPGLSFLMEWIAIYVAETWIALVAINVFINEVWSKSKEGNED